MSLIPKMPNETSGFDPLKVQCPPSDNITTAKLALIGEAPSSVEIMEREPFVGPAGSQLNRILSAAGLPRHQVYLTNACKAKLPKNNSNKLWTDKGFRCQEWGELQQQLIDELADFPGTVIVPMGATAMHLLLDEPRFDKITKLRGSVYPAERFPHLAKPLAGKLIALTFHPASSLPRNNPINFYIMISDLIKFNALTECPELLEVPVEILTEPSFREVEQFFCLLREHNEIAFDIEATPSFITCFSLAVHHEGELVSMSVPLLNNQGHYWSESEEHKVWLMLANVLGDKKNHIICQNGMFDLAYCLRAMDIKTSNFAFDTMQAQHIVYPDLPKGLDFLTSVYTYFPYYKDEGKLSHMTPIKDWKKYWKYNAKDSAYLIPIKKKLVTELEELNAMHCMDYVMALHKPLIEMEFNGILTDPKGIQETKKSYERRILALQHGLEKICKQSLNTNSSKQMIDYFYYTLKLKPYKNRKTGRPSCDAVALSRIARKGKQGAIEAKMILKMRKYNKLVSTYFRVKVDPDNKLRCTHKIAGTNTGRIATEKTFFGTGTNLQNQPYIFKKFLKPDKGKLLVECDLAKAEAHIVAYLTQDMNMIQSFESGIDVHSFNASKIFDVPIEDIIAEHHEKKVDQKETMRYLGKKIVHASNYGMGPQTFSDSLAKENVFIQTGKCKVLLNSYAARFPGLHRWHELTKETIMRKRILYNLYNRPKRFLGMMNTQLFRSAFSYIPQSSVAELLNRGMIKMAEEPQLGVNAYDIDLLFTVHDSVGHQNDVDKDLVKILLLIGKCMSHTFTYKGRSFEIGLDAKIGFHWAGSDTAEIESFTKENVEEALHKVGAK